MRILRSMPDVTAAPAPEQIRLVRQRRLDDCGIATAAMIAGVSYSAAWKRLAPPPATVEHAAAYHSREIKFLNQKGWWPSAQLLLKTVVSLEEMDWIIDNEERFKQAVEKSQRARIVLAFADGTKPDHSVIWDRDHQDVVFDPSRGVVPISELFNDAGLQTYSGALGFMAFCYQPGQPIRTLIKQEEGFVPPTASPIKE